MQPLDLRKKLAWMLTLGIVLLSHCVATGRIVEIGELNVIADASNRSYGLRYLDMRLSDGLALNDALANAGEVFPNVRRATPEEFDDLFEAAGIAYIGVRKASDGFRPGSTAIISSGDSYDGGNLLSILGATTGTTIMWTQIWTNPNAGFGPESTPDFLRLESEQAFLFRDDSRVPSPDVGWLLVSVPEPMSIVTAVLTAILAMGWFRSRRLHWR